MSKTPTRRARRDPDRTREAILVAAQDEFSAKGLAGGRVNVIARKAGANKRMIYHYFGSKEGLYLAALERVYEGLRGEERTMHLDHLAPEVAIRRLVEFNFDYSRAHPELISMINNENLHRARLLRKSRKVRDLHSPLVKLIDDILRRGVAEGVFRPGLDPVDVYITIAAVGFFYLSNNWTLSAIFGRRLDSDAALRRRKRHNVDMILHALRA
ncbi:MAG TPA: TetR/AcrR family transcriptional regulator [Xanthobacteraceae bacterium]|nr:TetR/AcrR family transcriptional regulator [Xanthobacteraceae bacterium]